MFIAVEKGGDSREVLQSEKYHANIINLRGLRARNQTESWISRTLNELYPYQ